MAKMEVMTEQINAGKAATLGSSTSVTPQHNSAYNSTAFATPLRPWTMGVHNNSSQVNITLAMIPA